MSAKTISTPRISSKRLLSPGLRSIGQVETDGEGGGFNPSLANDFTPWTPDQLTGFDVENDDFCARDDGPTNTASIVEDGDIFTTPVASMTPESSRERGGGENEGNYHERNDIVTILTQRTSEWIHDLEDKRRKDVTEQRISRALIGLRAASERSKQLNISPGLDRKAFSEPGKRSRLRDIVGDVGVAIFSPLDQNAFEPMNCEGDEESASSTASDISVLEDEEYPVEIVPENPIVLASCPRLLTYDMMQQLVDEALPEIVKTMHWKRAFAIGRDGDAFCTMLQCCSSFKHTIVAVQTTDGYILGGYATERWRRQEGHNTGRSFFGSGQSFLFSNHPSLATNEDAINGLYTNDPQRLHVFKWTGCNRYCQVFDVDNGFMAMGGGGAFGLIVEENFTRGGTGHCDTFGNPPLIPILDERFDIANFEVYGFVSPALMIAPPPSPVRHNYD